MPPDDVGGRLVGEDPALRQPAGRLQPAAGSAGSRARVRRISSWIVVVVACGASVAVGLAMVVVAGRLALVSHRRAVPETDAATARRDPGAERATPP